MMSDKKSDLIFSTVIYVAIENIVKMPDSVKSRQVIINQLQFSCVTISENNYFHVL